MANSPGTEEGNEGAAEECLKNIRKAHIQTAFVCAGRCIYCPYPECRRSNSHGYMNDAVFRAILSQLSPLTLDSVCLYLENEPFTDSAIFERAEAVWAICSVERLVFSTNALLLDGVKIKKLSRLLKKKAHEIRVVFHGITRNQYESVMGVPFAETLGNVIALLHAADEADLDVAIQCAGQGREGSLFQDFRCSQEDFFQFWESLFRKHAISKRPKLLYRPCLDRGGGSLHRDSLHTSPPVWGNPEEPRCPRISEWLHFLYTGDLILCHRDHHRETVFGNIADGDLRTLLSGKARKRALESAPALCKRRMCPGEWATTWMWRSSAP
jgi:hypothetical protein